MRLSWSFLLVPVLLLSAAGPVAGGVASDPPVIVSVSTIGDGAGSIEGLIVAFDRGVDASGADVGDFLLGACTCAVPRLEGTGDLDAFIEIRFEPEGDTASRPTLRYDRSTGAPIVDRDGLAVADEAAARMAVDGAAPLLLSAEAPGIGSAVLRLFFSEAVFWASCPSCPVRAMDFTYQDQAAGGATGLAVGQDEQDAVGNDVIELVLDGGLSAADDGTDRIGPVAGAIEDAAGNLVAANGVRIDADQTPPPAVTDLGLVRRAGSSITIDWTAPDVLDLDHFQVRYVTDCGAPACLTEATWESATVFSSSLAAVAPGSRQQIAVDGLAPDTTYHIGVKPVDEGGNVGALSTNIVRAATQADTQAPTPPGFLRMDSAATDRVVLSWTAPADDSGSIARYELYRSTSPVTTSALGSAVAPAPPTAGAGTAQTYTVDGLVAGTTYHFGLRAVDFAGNIGPLATTSATTTTTGGGTGGGNGGGNGGGSGSDPSSDPGTGSDPPPVFVPDCTPDEDGEPDEVGEIQLRSSTHPQQCLITRGRDVSFVWDALEVESGTVVYRYAFNGDPDYEVGTSDPVATTRAHTRQDVGDGFWTFHLRAYTADGPTETFHYTIGIDGTPPGRIDDLELVPGTLSAGSATFRWHMPGGEQVHRLAFAIHDEEITEDNWDDAGRIEPAPIPGFPGDLLDYGATGLEAGTLYYVALRGHDEIGNPSALSNVVAFSTEPDTTPPAALAGLRSPSHEEGGIGRQVELTWEASEDPESTVVYYVAFNQDAEYEVTRNDTKVTGASTSVSASGPGAWYAHVRPGSSGGLGEQQTVRIEVEDLSAGDLLAANRGIVTTATREGGTNQVAWTLPRGLPAEPLGVQLWASNSPYILVADLEAGGSGFAAGSYDHAGAFAQEGTGYLVTVYFERSAAGGYFDGEAGEAPDTSTYPPTPLQAPAAPPADHDILPLWLWALLVIVPLAILGAVGALVIVRRRQAEAAAPVAREEGPLPPEHHGDPQEAPWAPGGDGFVNGDEDWDSLEDWDETDPTVAPVPELEEAPVVAATGVDEGAAVVDMDVACHACDTPFNVRGSLPLTATCPSCGESGLLEAEAEVA